MAENSTQTLDNLNQNNLGDKKLSREEISYIQSKDQLWFKDIGDKLFDDIVSTNEKLLKESASLKAFIDDIILQPETLRQIAQKAGISLGKVEKMFSEGNQNLDNKTNKYYIVVNLLLYGCTKNIFPEVRGNLIDNMNTPAFTGATAKALHKFQKMGENTQGRSKADCLLGPKTLQQMLSYLGVQTVNQKVDTETFARSNISAKEKYEWNAEQKNQMDVIINDPALTPEQKVLFLAKVANKTVDVGSDKLNKKYGAVSYMCQLIANNLMVGATPEHQESIVAAVLPYEKLIKKYWNEKSAVEFGIDPKLVPKTNDFVKDIKDMAKSVESKYQSNTIMAQTALQICSAWILYYQQDNPKGRKKNQASIEAGMKELQSLYDHKTSGDIRQNIAAAMDKIFFDTATSYDFSTVTTDNVVVGGVDIAGSFTSFENLQKRAFKGVKNIFLADKKRNATESKNATNEILTAFRYIDKEMDGDFDIGVGEKFRIGTWKTSDGIKSTVENMGMSGLVLDVKNAPQEFTNEQKEFTNEQNAIKNGVQNIKTALENDPNGSIAQKVDKLLAAIASNDTTTIKTIIKDAELFGIDVSDKSIGEITKRMQEISKQNEKNKVAVLNDMKKNYNKIYEQMKGTQLWLKEQGRGDEADMVEGNKQVFEALLNGGIVINPPVGLEQFTGKSLESIASEEIRKMERMQLTGVLEVGLMRGLMIKYEDVLKTLAEKTGLSADENLIKMYADIDGFDGSWKDETCNMVGAIVAEILITIAVCILTAGVGGIIVNGALKIAQGVFKAVRWGSMVTRVARIGQLGNTSLKIIRTATGVSKTVKATQTAAKILYRTTALLAEAPAFNTVSKMIHNGIEGNTLLEGVLGGYTDANGVYHKSTLNPIAKENIQTAAFLGVMHGFSVLKSGAVSINFGKAGEVFAKSPQFLKSASSVAGEFTTMMASEEVMNLTFGREIPDPNDPTKTIIERGIHIPEKKDVIQMVGMILGMRASAKFNLWPKIEAKLKTGEFTILKVEKNDVVIADNSGNKMRLFADQAKVKDAIEMKKTNAEQRKVDKEANGGKQSQAQKNIDMVVRMKTRNAPNKIGTRTIEKAPGNKKVVEVVSKDSELIAIKSDIKLAIDYIGLKKSNVVTIEGKKHMFLGVKEGKALFVEKGVAGATPKEFSTVESMKDINFEPGSKETNSGRKAKFDELINAKEVVVEPQNSIVDNTSQGNAKNNIESQFNNFDKSPSQKKIDSFNKWYEKQSSFELEVLQAQELMRGVDQKLLSKAMITLMNAKDISQLSSNDIKRIQKEIGIQPKNADGIRGPESQLKLEALLLKSGAGKKTTFNLERGGSKSKRNIDKTTSTEIIPGLGTYEYSKRNNWLRFTLKTPHGTMQAESHDITNNEFILHADIGNNRLVAGKAYKFIFDKLPEGAKIMEKNNLSGDSYTNLLKLYQKGNTNEYKIYAGGYVELNLQGKNSSLSKLIIENRIPEEGTIAAFFKTKMAAQNVVTEITKSTSGLGLPEPRIVERPDGTFVIELPNIIIEKGGVIKPVEKGLESNNIQFPALGSPEFEAIKEIIGRNGVGPISLSDGSKMFIMNNLGQGGYNTFKKVVIDQNGVNKEYAMCMPAKMDRNATRVDGYHPENIFENKNNAEYLKKLGLQVNSEYLIKYIEYGNSQKFPILLNTNRKSYKDIKIYDGKEQNNVLGDNNSWDAIINKSDKIINDIKVIIDNKINLNSDSFNISYNTNSKEFGIFLSDVSDMNKTNIQSPESYTNVVMSLFIKMSGHTLKYDKRIEGIILNKIINKNQNNSTKNPEVAYSTLEKSLSATTSLDSYQKTLETFGDNKIQFNDIVLTARQLSQRITEIRKEKLDIAYLPKEVRSIVSEKNVSDINTNRENTLNTNEKQILNKIRNKESVAGMIKEYRWTHRTTLDAL